MRALSLSTVKWHGSREDSQVTGETPTPYSIFVRGHEDDDQSLEAEETGRRKSNVSGEVRL
jgi:hypothetical protein